MVGTVSNKAPWVVITSQAGRDGGGTPVIVVAAVMTMMMTVVMG